MNLIEVGVVGAHEGSRELLQRRVGSVLKNIANVRVLDETSGHAPVDLIVAHSYGGRAEHLKQKFKSAQVIGIELVLLPIGVRTLMAEIKSGEKVGVVAEHLRCANYLMSEVIKSGVFQPYFQSGTFSQMSRMKVDRFIVAEEMLARVPDRLLHSDRLLTVPRMISPESSARLIHAAMEIANSMNAWEIQQVKQVP